MNTAAPEPSAVVKPNRCQCHPETCCCADYVLYVKEEVMATGSRERMDRLAEIINAREIDAAPAAAVGGDPCVICSADEPYTGTCGSNDRRALCNQRRTPAAPVGGFVVVPSKIHVDADAWEAITFAIGGPSTGEGEPYMDSTLWIGEIEQDDGSKLYGLHVSCNECPEEGSITLATFPSPAAQPSAKDGVRGEDVVSMRDALTKCREVLRNIIRDKKGGVHYAAAQSACHWANEALEATTATGLVDGHLKTAMRLLGAVKATHWYGIVCPDVDGQNWFYGVRNLQAAIGREVSSG